MPIRFDALDSVVGIEGVLILHDLENLFTHGHFLVCWEQSTWLLLLAHLVKRVRSDLLQSVSGVRIRVQNFADEVSAVRGDELGNLVFSCQYFLVEVGSLGVLKGQEATDHSEQDHP